MSGLVWGIHRLIKIRSITRMGVISDMLMAVIFLPPRLILGSSGWRPRVRFILGEYEPHQYSEIYRNNQTTSTKCQYQAAASNPKW